MRWLIGCLSLVLASCSNSPFVKVEERGVMPFDCHQTFSLEEQFMSSSDDTSKPFLRLSSNLKSSLESSMVEKNLRRPSYRQVADITIQLWVDQTHTWDVIEYPYIVYMPDHQQQYYHAHGFQYGIGKVTIRMIDTTNGKLIWQARVSTPLAHNDEQAADRLRESFEKLFY